MPRELVNYNTKEKKYSKGKNTCKVRLRDIWCYALLYNNKKKMKWNKKELKEPGKYRKKIN